MILVSGGTGLVGSAVVRALLNRGESVAVLGRDASKISNRFGDAVEARTGEVRDPASLTSAMAGIDTVITAVQFPTAPVEIPRKGWTFREVDFEGTVNQVNAAKSAGVQRFLYVSGVGAGPDATQHWFRHKYGAEQHLAASGLNWTVVRPTWVYGPADRSLNRILGFTKFLPFLPLFGDGKNPMQPVFVDDVGRVIAEAATRPEAINQVFELGGPDVMSMDDVFKTALDVMGRSRPILHQPIFVGKVAGTLLSVLPTPPLTPDAVEFITQSAVADDANLHRVLSPALTPFRDGLSTYLGDHRQSA